MKKLFFLLFLLPAAALAQKEFKTHTVGPKESLSSIGRLYNINGRELANYNKIDYDKGLSLGQVLKIPVNNGAANAATPVTKPVQEVKPVVVKSGAAIYHTVEKKQTLYAISKLYSTTVDNIKKWNNLPADGVSEGAKIIVGYGDVAVSNKATDLPEKKLPENIPEQKNIAVVEQKATTEKAPPVVKQEPKPEKKEEPVKKTTPPPANNVAANFNGGVFKTDYAEQAKTNHIITESGNGGIFKSTSGWQDGKYYCLHNMATPGTIIKITNNANGKFVYAKVLDLMPDIKQNSNLIIAVSNAAADVLGAAEGKLDFTLNYSK